MLHWLIFKALKVQRGEGIGGRRIITRGVWWEEVDALHVIEKLAAAAFIDIYFADTKLAIQRFVVLHGVHVKVKMSRREAPSLICNKANECKRLFQMPIVNIKQRTINQKTTIVLLLGRQHDTIKLRHVDLRASWDIVCCSSDERSQGSAVCYIKLNDIVR